MQLARTIALGLLAAIVGCNSGPSTAEVTGEVKKGGQPLDNVTVVFYPSNGPSVVAKTDASGAFTAKVPVGPAKIAVVDASEASSEDTSPKAASAAKKSRVNSKYNAPEMSGLTTNVGEQKDKLILNVD